MVDNLRGRWSLPTALAFLMWFVFAPQCISTIAVTRRETNGWKWPAFMVGYLFAAAYIMAGITYWLAGLRRLCREGIMAGSVNKVIIVGNLGRDPESKIVPERRQGRQSAHRDVRIVEGQDVAASARKRPNGIRSRSSTKGSPTSPNDILRKGSKVYIEGALQTRKWQDAAGQDRYSTEIVLQGFNSVLTMLDGAPGAGGGWRRRRWRQPRR